MNAIVKFWRKKVQREITSKYSGVLLKLNKDRINVKVLKVQGSQ